MSLRREFALGKEEEEEIERGGKKTQGQSRVLAVDYRGLIGQGAMKVLRGPREKVVENWVAGVLKFGRFGRGQREGDGRRLRWIKSE